MSTTIQSTTELDALVIGGGVAGLWCLDALIESGLDAALLESTALGTGQSISAQGILHGGVKYSLSGLLDPASKAISEMPKRWDRSLAGTSSPDLARTTIRTEACHLWRTDDLRSRAGMVGAKLALRVRPQALAASDRPAPLRACPGEVALLPEKVVETPSLLQAFADLHPERLIWGSLISGDARSEEGADLRIRVADETELDLRVRRVILTAGAGTPELMKRLQLPTETISMQRRPLHMAMVKGPPDRLPELNGHCADGGRTRVTITSSTSRDGNRVWQLGGALAEDGCEQTPPQLIESATACLAQVLPGFDPEDPSLLWATYRIDRAEKTTAGAGRPSGGWVGSLGSAIIAWPTKLVLAPATADRILQQCPPARSRTDAPPPLVGLPTPPIAQPPWEVATWT
ncbi:MAG: FAD-dependent oxidoreductase [Planctomycetota bacterium]|nr:FAD-dependent oxidoreductase [Planctomycetota bacterium]